MSSTTARRFGAASLPALRPRIALVGDAPTPYGEPITCSDHVWSVLRYEAETWDRERFITIALDTKKRILGIEEVSVGTLDASMIHPREIFKGLILANAHCFICAHNHPSGDPQPSPNDECVTKRLVDAGALLGIPLIDHIILAPTGFYSFQDHGRLY